MDKICLAMPNKASCPPKSTEASQERSPMRLFAFSLLLSLSIFPVRAFGAPALSAKEAKVRKLMELTGAANIGRQVIDAMVAQFGNNPQIPADFPQRFAELAKTDELVDMIVPVYLKHLTESDLDDAIAFYASPGGQRLVKAQPLIMAEAMQLGQEWGRKLAMKALEPKDASDEKNSPKGAKAKARSK
jgi:uncharacterized protein